MVTPPATPEAGREHGATWAVARGLRKIALGYGGDSSWKSNRHGFDVWIQPCWFVFLHTMFFPSNQPFQKWWTFMEASETDQGGWETGRHPVIEWLTATSSCIQTGKLLLQVVKWRNVNATNDFSSRCPKSKTMTSSHIIHKWPKRIFFFRARVEIRLQFWNFTNRVRRGFPF